MGTLFESKEEIISRENGEAHNKGQEDAAKGVNETPNTWLSEQFSQRAEDENDHYRAGQENHENQKR